MARQISWGSAELTFERPVFLAGFQSGRFCYFYEQDGDRSLSDVELLTVIASSEKGSPYQFEFELLDHPEHGVEELIGMLIGYLSAPIIPETTLERAERLSSTIEVVQS